MTVERVPQEEQSPRTVNDLVNEALLRWAAVTKVDPKDNRFRFRISGGGDLEPFDNWTLKKHLEDLNKSRDLDPSGLTTLMMLRGLTEHHLKTNSFSAHDLLLDPESCKAELEAMRGLRDLVEDPLYVSVIEDFINLLRRAADHYGVPGGHENKPLKKLLEDRYALAFLRRDALRSIETLEAHQFTHGAADQTDFKYNLQVYEFWNVNSLLKTLLGQAVPGISMCLIRDPEEALASFFMFAIRNGETIMALTDRDKTPHPAFNRMTRRPDRHLDERAERHWFPYGLLDIELTEDGHLFAKEREGLVSYNLNAVPLKKVGELGAGEFVWTVMMFDLIRDRFWKENKRLPAASYTGEMVVQPHALIGANSSLVKRGLYEPLIAPPLTLDDVSFEATKKQWLPGWKTRKKSTFFNAWMEERYGAQVPEVVLNPVGEEGRRLLEAHLDETGIRKKLDKFAEARGETSALEKLETFSPLAFGKKEDLERDRVWVGRVNKMRYVQALAVKEFETEHEKALKWWRDRVWRNSKVLVEAAVRGEMVLEHVDHGHGETGFKHAYEKRTQKNCAQREIKDQPPYGIRDGIGLHGGKQMRPTQSRWNRDREYWTGKVYCFEKTSFLASVHTYIRPTCPQALATLAGVEIKDLPWGLQHWYDSEPYSGNSILDRVEPSDWVLDNPWMKLHLVVCVSLCKQVVHAKRKELGLPPEKLQEKEEKDS